MKLKPAFSAYFFGFFAATAVALAIYFLQERNYLFMWICWIIAFIFISLGSFLLIWRRIKYRQTPIEKKYENYLFYYKSISAASIRLLGASDEYFTPDRVSVETSRSFYELPDEFIAGKDDIINRKKRSDAMYHNDPNMRLIHYRASPINDQTEKKHIELQIGQIWWDDYTVIKEHLDVGSLAKNLTKYINLDDVAYHKDIKNSKLTNILCTATTIITIDGYAAYSIRSKRVSTEPNKYTSSVAENISPIKDRVFDPGGLYDIPIPFRTAIRGIEEELSPKLSRKISNNANGLLLLGIDFDLHGMHPDLLFMLAWPEPYSKMLDDIKSEPGTFFIEGRLKSVKIEAKHLGDLLSNQEWIPGGKASFMRTIEFLTAYMRNHNLDYQTFINYFGRGKYL